MARTAVYAGSFDPPTLGHLDVIARAARLFDRLVVGVVTNPGKDPLFSTDERAAMLRRDVGAWPHVEVTQFTGLVVDFARAEGAVAMVRGLRSATDLDYEAQMAGMNGMVAPEIETLFLAAAPALQPIASSLVKQIARRAGRIEAFGTPAVAADMAAKLAQAQE